MSSGDYAGTYSLSEDADQQARCSGACYYINAESDVGICMCDPGDVEYTLPESCDGTFIYLSQSIILRLPSFTEVSCNQNFPEDTSEAFDSSSAAMVMHKGKQELIVCGGFSMTGCRVWTDQGWDKIETSFNRIAAASSLLNNKTWLVTGGFNGTNVLKSTQIYTEAGFQNSVELPVVTTAHCQLTMSGIVYLMGGGTATEVLGTTYKLAENDNQWVSLGSLNTPRFAHACVEFNGDILAIGGYNGTAYIPSVERYNPLSNEWVKFPSLPKAMCCMQALIFEGDVYVFGGHTGSEYNMAVYKLGKTSQTWEYMENISLSIGDDNVLTNHRAIFPAIIRNGNDIRCSN